MVCQSDNLGRFLPGNTVAKGNKGNRNPKWLNGNAIKHGLFRKIYPGANMLMPSYDGTSIVVIVNSQAIGTLEHTVWKNINGKIYIDKRTREELQVHLGISCEDINLFI